MMKKIILLLAITLSATSVFAQKDSDRPLIIVSGQAEVMVVPDEVVFRLKVESVNLDVNIAKAKTDDGVKKIVALARSYKIEPQNVQTDFIRITEHYTQPTQYNVRKFDGYAVTQTTAILLKDVTRFESLLAELVKAGVSDVSDVSFRASQMRKYMDQARAFAMKAAREKAVALAAEIGQRPGKAHNITEVGTTVMPAYDEDNGNGASNYIANASSEIRSNVADNQGTIAPGLISITVRVKVSFELN